MELEKLKAALNERKFEGYLFERPARQIALDIRRRAKSIEAKERAHDIQTIVGGLAMAVVFFFWFDSRQSFWSNAGIALIIAGTVLVAACTASVYLPGRRVRFDLPRQEFLAEERKRLRTRIRVLRRDGVWACTPLIAGFLLYFASYLNSIVEYAICVVVLAGACAATWWSSTHKHGKVLKSLLNEIELELAQLNASTRS